MALRSELHPVGANEVLLNGTVASMVATTGTQGQSWYNTTYNAWFDWIVDRWIPRQPDPRYGFTLFDEFLGTDRIGQLDWITTGTAPVIQLATSNVPGAYGIRQATALAHTDIRSNSAGLQLGTMDLYLEASVSIPVLATVSEDFSAAFGLNDGAVYDANSACTDGAYISINRAANGAKWITNTSSGGSNTATSTTVTDIVAATQYRLGILFSATNNNVTFYQNGVLMATHTSNLPTSATHQTGYCFRVDKTAGSAVSAINPDYFYSWGFFNGQRIA